MRLNETEMVKLLPAWMQEDGGDKGLATGCDIISRDAYARLKLLSRWDKIDQLSDAELDEMAWELNIQWYDSTAPIAAKRAVIRNSDRVYAKLGTPYAVEQIVADYFGTGEVREWYQYGGQPHHFKVLSDNPSLVNSNLDLFLKLLRTVKRRSSWLDAILICLTGEMFLYSGMAVRDHTQEVHVMGSDEIHIYHAAVVHDNNRETVSIGTDAAVISDKGKEIDMAAFINNDITTAGLIVLAKGVAGQKINYTKIVLGDGYLEEGQTPRTLTGVVSPKATVDITKLKINGDGTVAVGGIFTNGDETDGFYYRELGLYAEDPDPEVGEVLYCYGNCGDLAEWIPPSGGATIVEKTIDIVTAIGTATNVTAYIPADAYATKEDYETYKAIALGAQATAEEALALARQAIAIAQAAEASVNDLSNAVGQNTSKIATLWDAVFSEITTNPFQITFADLTGITLTAGIWNSGLQRLEC